MDNDVYEDGVDNKCWSEWKETIFHAEKVLGAVTYRITVRAQDEDDLKQAGGAGAC